MVAPLREIMAPNSVATVNADIAARMSEVERALVIYRSDARSLAYGSEYPINGQEAFARR